MDTQYENILTNWLNGNKKDFTALVEEYGIHDFIDAMQGEITSRDFDETVVEECFNMLAYYSKVKA